MNKKTILVCPLQQRTCIISSRKYRMAKCVVNRPGTREGKPTSPWIVTMRTTNVAWSGDDSNLRPSHNTTSRTDWVQHDSATTAGRFRCAYMVDYPNMTLPRSTSWSLKGIKQTRSHNHNMHHSHLVSYLAVCIAFCTVSAYYYLDRNNG